MRQIWAGLLVLRGGKMIRSMTGYGKQSLNIDKREYQVEIKSVNHRYLDINIKLPKSISYLEDTIKKEISEKNTAFHSV